MSSIRTQKNLPSLLKIEDDPELIEITCPVTGIPVWSLIRVAAIRVIISEWYFKSTPLSLAGRDDNYLKLAKKATLSALHNLRCKNSENYNVLIQSTGLGNYMREGVVHDRLAGYFAEAAPDQTLIWQAKVKESFGDKYAFDHLIHKAPRDISHKIFSRVATRDSHRQLATRITRRLIENAKKELGFEFSLKEILILKSSLSSRLAILPFASEHYANWFAKQGFKLILKEDACYGGGGIPVIHAAKLNNMVVAEYQHGTISKGHDAYNASDTLTSSDLYKKILPDHLLTYGKWWKTQSNLPVNKISVGNPHLTESIKKYKGEIEKLDKILILGDGVKTLVFLELAKKIAKIARRKGMIVVFRPHPFERDKINTANFPVEIKLDQHSNIYPSLMETKILISEVSTGLFEALGLVDQVLLWETERSRFAFPELPFQSFSSIDELESILNATSSVSVNSNTVPASELWEPNWKQNYLRFVEGVVGS